MREGRRLLTRPGGSLTRTGYAALPERYLSLRQIYRVNLAFIATGVGFI